MTANVSAPQKKPQAAWVGALLIGLRLLLICAVVAGIISLVYTVTKPKAEANLKATKAAAISEIFGASEPSDGQDGFYTVRYGENLSATGYCIESTAGGFGGDLTLMVGFDADGKILGVSIVSLSETPGLGARVDDADYLSQYKGKSGSLGLNKDGGSDIDAISGATYSSRAVISAVNAATERLQSYLASGGDAQ